MEQESEILSPITYKKLEEKIANREQIISLVSSSGSSRSSGFVPLPHSKQISDFCPCKHNCDSKFSPSVLSQTQLLFKTKSKLDQNLFIAQCSVKEDQDSTYKYFLPAYKETRTAVCKDFFCSALGIGPARLYKVIKQAHVRTISKITDNRGKWSRETVNFSRKVDFASMKQWMLSLPMQLSHFSRAAQVPCHYILLLTSSGKANILFERDVISVRHVQEIH
jgi:hypothetical protein